MRLAAGALALLTLALLLSWPVVTTNAPARIAVAYVMAALLAISLFVAAHYYRIVPFLVWYHRFGPLIGRRAVPKVSELFSARVATGAVVALLGGALLLIGSVALGAAVPARIGALLFACGVTVEAAQMILLWRTRP